LSQLARAGISEGVLCAHYRAEQVAEQLAELSRHAGLPLSLVVEQSPLGTAHCSTRCASNLLKGGIWYSTPTPLSTRKVIGR
jgi:NDP-sugar pyrophosphorylase family protein